MEEAGCFRQGAHTEKRPHPDRRRESSALVARGILDRDDAWEYLANAREAWRSPEEEAAVAERLAAAVEYEDDGEDDEDGGDDEEETIDEEPLWQIVERLDATVFGLIEALDSDRADLPKPWTKRSRVRSGPARSRVRTRSSPAAQEGVRGACRSHLEDHHGTSAARTFRHGRRA